MALLFTAPRFLPVTSDGVMPGALLNFYQTGTSTPQAVYADPAYTTALSNPVEATDAGLFPTIYLNDTGPNYKVVCTDANGVQLWSVDPYILGPTRAQIAMLLYPRTGAEIAASVTPTDYSYPPGDIRRYGASAGAGTDQSSYFAAAIAAHPESVILPAGEFHVNLDLDGVRGLVMRGAGRDKTILRNFADAPVITLDNTSGDCKLNVFEGFRISNRSEGTYTAADGIYLTGDALNENDFHVFRDIEITDMRYGFYYTNRSVWNSFEDVHVYSCVDGFRAVTTENISAFHFRQCRFGSNTGYGIYVSKASGDLLMSWSFDNVTLEKNALNGLRVSGAASGIGGWVFNGLYCEENTGDIAASATNPRKANIYIDAAYCVGLVLNGWQSFGMPSGDQIDWHIYMDAACTNASGAIIGARWGVSATVGAYNLTTSFLVASDFGTVGSAVAPRGSGNFALTDITGSGTSFTPTLSFGGGSTGLAYSNQIGRYMRVGNALKFWIYISLSSKGSSTGAAVVGGLPVAAANISNLSQAVAIRGDQFQSSVDGLQAFVAANSQSITLERFFDGVKTDLDDTDFGNSTALTISGELLLN